MAATSPPPPGLGRRVLGAVPVPWHSGWERPPVPGAARGGKEPRPGLLEAALPWQGQGIGVGRAHERGGSSFGPIAFHKEGVDVRNILEEGWPIFSARLMGLS